MLHCSLCKNKTLSELFIPNIWIPAAESCERSSLAPRTMLKSMRAPGPNCFGVPEQLRDYFSRPVGVLCVSIPLRIPNLGPGIAHIPQTWKHSFCWGFIICMAFLPPNSHGSQASTGGRWECPAKQIAASQRYFYCSGAFADSEEPHNSAFSTNHHPSSQSCPAEGN